MVRTDEGIQYGLTRQKSGGFSGGFTIIEVLLFLGVSALLLTVAIISVGANINNNRFNDAVRSTTSYLQGQYAEVQSGLSDRSTGLGCDSAGSTNVTNIKAPGMTNCVVLGRLIKLQGNTLTSRYILGYQPTLSGLSADDTTAINQMQPWVADGSTFSGGYAIPWGIGIANSTIPASPSPVTSLGLAIVRSPASGNVLYYAFPVTSATPTLGASVIRAAYYNRNIDVCINDASSGRTGRIRIAAGQGQEVIQTDLATTGNCP